MDERQLMARVALSDVSAFDQILEMHWQTVVAYSRRFAADADIAGDIAQETFVRLWQSRRSWEAGRPVRPWLLRTARNLCISERRKRDVRERWVQIHQGSEVQGPRTPLQTTENSELRGAIADAIEQLSPRRREVFTLFHLHDLSYREVAEIMDIREQSVANHLQAAVGQLRSRLRRFFPSLTEPTDADGDDSDE